MNKIEVFGVCYLVTSMNVGASVSFGHISSLPYYTGAEYRPLPLTNVFPSHKYFPHTSGVLKSIFDIQMITQIQ